MTRQVSTMQAPAVLRREGMAVIREILRMEEEEGVHGDYGRQGLAAQDVLDEYDTVQRMAAMCAGNIRTLIRWRAGRTPGRWQWLSPFIAGGPPYTVFDDHNMGFVTDAYKGRAAVMLIGPGDFLSLADPHGTASLREHTIERLYKRMSACQTIDTPYLMMDEDGRIFGHEGRHRATAARRYGMRLMPAYLYSHHAVISDDEMRMLAGGRIRDVMRMRGKKDRKGE